jgi:endonuclease-3 related protein
MDNLPADAGLFNEYHALLVCLAKDVCRNRPLCQRCCLNGICHFYLLAGAGDSDVDAQRQG